MLFFFNLLLGKQSAVFNSQGCGLNTWEVEAPAMDPAGNKLFYSNKVGLSMDIDVKYKTFLLP